MVLVFAPVAHAATLEEQIRTHSAAANAQRQQASGLRAQGDTLANKVAAINAQAEAIASQIALNKAKQQKLNQDIEKAQQELVTKKQILDENVRTIYQQSQITPLEMLASSKDFSEYVERQQYMDTIKDHVTEASRAIVQLKADLEKQNAEVTNIIKDQSNLSAALAAQRAEQAQLLAQTRGEESRYAEMAKANNAQAEKLKAQQAAILASRFGGAVSGGGSCGGGYPGHSLNSAGLAWGCNYAKDNTWDKWGMFNRECVSYTAFKVAASGRYMPYWGGSGNAKQWPGNAQGADIAVSFGSGARAGDVAIDTSGPYGHAMYVERVEGGNVFVSQYNFRNQGEYSTMTIPQSGLHFIHF